jgi:hypothetical protein
MKILWLAACILNNNTTTYAFSSSSLSSSTLQASTTIRLGAGNEDAVDVDDNTCGEGFYPVKGEHGGVCVFDYEAAATSFGIATKEQEFVCDANDYWKELEERNQARKKFDMAPLTPEQFVVLQTQIMGMEVKGQEKLAVAKNKREKEEESAAAAALLVDDGKSNSVLKDFLGLFEDTCESNYDCNRPMVCCDFGFKRQCCDGGKTAKSLYGEYALIPVPMTNE